MHIRQIFQSLFQKNSQRSMKSATGFEDTSKQIKFAIMSLLTEQRCNVR